MLPYNKTFPPEAERFLPFQKVKAKKIGFFTQKNRFFGSKNVIFLRLLSEGAKIKCGGAMIKQKRAAAKAKKVFCQMLSKGSRLLCGEFLYCEGVIPVTALNCEDRYAADE